jgi:hypothetical protein
MFEFISGSAISDVEAQEHYDRFFEVSKLVQELQVFA